MDDYDSFKSVSALIYNLDIMGMEIVKFHFLTSFPWLNKV